MSKQEISPDPENSQKQKHWNETASLVEQMTDRLSYPVDQDIKEGIIGLNIFGINTVGSCEGHPDRGMRAPYIDLEAKGVGVLRKQIKELGDTEENKAKVEEIFNKIERENAEELQKLFQYLDEFYKGRDVPFQKRLIVTGPLRGRSRLKSQGVTLQTIETEKTKQQNLPEYQEEMGAFTTFLKKKYLSTEG